MVNDDQIPPSNSKTYTQRIELDKLRTHWEEQFKLHKAIDKTILEKEIQNHYLHQIQSLKNEHQCYTRKFSACAWWIRLCDGIIRKGNNMELMFLCI